MSIPALSVVAARLRLFCARASFSVGSVARYGFRTLAFPRVRRALLACGDAIISTSATYMCAVVGCAGAPIGVGRALVAWWYDAQLVRLSALRFFSRL